MLLHGDMYKKSTEKLNSNPRSADVFRTHRNGEAIFTSKQQTQRHYTSCCALCTHTHHLNCMFPEPFITHFQVHCRSIRHSLQEAEPSTASLNRRLCSAFWKHPNEIGDEWNNSHKHAAVFNIPLRDARQRKLCTDYCFVREMHSGLQWGGRLY